MGQARSESGGAGDGLDETPPPSTLVYRVVAQPRIGGALVIGAALMLALFGVFGVFRWTGAFSLRPDTRVMYVAGRMWLEGRSPYPVAAFLQESDALSTVDHDFMASGFGYLPTAWPLCGLLALVRPTPAFLLMLTLNLAAVGVAAVYAVRLSSVGVAAGPLRDSLRFFVAAAVIGSPFTTHIVFQGQSTMIATAALVSGWYYAFVRPRPNAAGVLFALPTMKLQIALFAVVGLIMARRWRVLATMVLAGLVIVAYPIVAAGGPIALVRGWLTEVRSYSAIPGNAVGYANVFGLQSLLVAAGLHAPGLGILSVPLLAAVWWYRERFEPDELLALLVASSCLLLYAHDYDLAALVPLHGFMWKRVGAGRWSALAVAAFYALLFAPQRGFRGRVPPVFLHWREVVLLAALVWLAAVVVRRPPLRDLA